MIERLRLFPWGRFVSFAYLTGSWAVGRRGRDVDIIVPPLDRYGELLEALVKYLGMNEDLVDLIPLTERAPCPLVLDALSKAVPLHVDDLDYVLRIYNICQDWYADYRKLDLHEAALTAVR